MWCRGCSLLCVLFRLDTEFGGPPKLQDYRGLRLLFLKGAGRELRFRPLGVEFTSSSSFSSFSSLGPKIYCEEHGFASACFFLY